MSEATKADRPLPVLSSEGLGAAVPQASLVENTTSEWMTGESPPWSAYLQRVELELEDGRTVQGELFVSEELFDGEEEVAVWSVRDDAGHEHILNNKPWRFCTHKVSFNNGPGAHER